MNTLSAEPPIFSDFEFDALSEAHNYRAALLREFGPFLRGSVLEVGAGIGQFACELSKKPEIRKLISIEPNQSFCNHIHAHFPHLDVLHGTIDNLTSDVGWNAVFSANVLEHIETDEKELASYHRFLKLERGALCLFVPARPEIYAPIDRDFGHFRRYTRSELRRKLEDAGFVIQRLRYYNIVGYLAWWINFCVLKRRSFDARSVVLFDRAIFPVVHWSETHICPPPLGQSLLAVAIAQ